MSKVSIVKSDNTNYPSKENLLNKDNYIFQMIRDGLHMLGLDNEHFGTPDWNPLKSYISPGNHVLIKPNMVLHFNAYGGGTDCLYTHPSLITAMIEYASIALQGSGKIVVGDAPLQECVFERLIEDGGYDLIVNQYRAQGLDISLSDFRNVKTTERDGIHYLQEETGSNGILVQVDDASAFSGISDDKAENMRITNYDPRILRKHHSTRHHEYMVASEVLDADVIINMPKPKTHRKAGVTISLKNLVGINANKEYLPHHTLGSKKEGGDAYLEKDTYLSLANEVLDIKNMLVNDGEYELAKIADQLYGELRNKNLKERYWEGSWYGNDTIWRTIADLNRILLYADKNGKLKDTKQRKLFIVGDMIVSGEMEGPLEPSPIYPGVIVFGDDPVVFDETACSLMGFDYHDIPSIEMPGIEDKKKLLSDGGEPEIISNDENWNGNTLKEIRENYSLAFTPSRGWVEKLGSPKLERIIYDIKSKDSRIYVFGAGENGRFIASELKRRDILIEAFCDNNVKLHGKMIQDGVMCISPHEIDKGIPVLITVKLSVLEEVKKQLEVMNCQIIGCV